MVMTPPSDSSVPGSPGLQPLLSAVQGVPRAEFFARPNSHPFQNRTLLFTGADQQIKVGRSVARSKPSPNNGIFDCKVLSRNHALIWYENGKFYLQDTKSSNGTFVNNQRLSKGSEESVPREVCSGDILQFGVDVVENSRKVTHGCIIATLKLYLPDGKEAKASPTIVSSVSSTSLPTQDLYQLHHYIQEALAREQLLENKLAVLQRLVGQTETASTDAWKSLIDEDRLLTRVEILESQLSTYGKGVSEDKLREEAIRLMEEKERYQETAKDTLKKLVEEKLETVKRMSDIERSLSNTEDEFSTLKELYDREVEENRKLAEEITRLSAELEEKLAKEEEAAGDGDGDGDGDGEEGGHNQTERIFEGKSDGDNISNSKENRGDEGSNSYDFYENQSEESQVSTLKERLNLMTQELSEVRRNYEEVSLMSRSYRDELEETKDRLRDALETLDTKDQALDELESRAYIHQTNVSENPREIGNQKSFESETGNQNSLTQSEREAFEAMKQQISRLTSLAEENDMLRSDLEKSAFSIEKMSRLESALHEAETKISELLRVKEKFAELSEEKLNQTLSLNELEDQVESLSFQSRIATCLALFPIFVLCLAICMAYLPVISSLFGTADKL